jgi:N-acetylneuraminic acid mutarotase
MQEYLLIFRSYLYSLFSFLPIVLGFIVAFRNNSKGVRRIVVLFSFAILIALLYNVCYILLLSPYILASAHLLLGSPFLIYQVINSLGSVILGMFFALFMKYIIKKQVGTMVTTAQAEVQPEIPRPSLGKVWKISIIIIILVIMAVAGYFGYREIQKLNQEKQAQDQYSKDAQKKQADDKKYFSQKIATVFAIGGNVIGDKKGVYPESSSVEYYNPKDNIWKQAPNMGTARTRASAVGTQDKVYVFGGSTLSNGEIPLTSVEEFDPQTKAWSYKKSMNEGRNLASVIYLNGKIYVIGGQGNSYEKLNSVDIYDPATDEWTSGPSMPGNIVSDTPLCGAIGTKIYCLGVAEGKYTLVLDTVTNTWEKVGTENRSNTFVGSGDVVNNSIVSVISRPPDDTYLSTYNSGTDSYSKDFTSVYFDKNSKPEVNFPKLINSFGVAALGDYMLVIGGDTSSGPRPEVYAINASYPKSWFKAAPLLVARENMAIAEVPILYGGNQAASGVVGGTIFADSNKNHKLDPGEKAIPNLKIILVTTQTYYSLKNGKRIPSEDFGNDLAVTYTDSQGNYAFNNVPPGKYRVDVQDPKNAGERSVITKYPPEANFTQSFALKSGEKVDNYSFGIINN